MKRLQINNRILSIFCIISILTVGCSPIYKCGDPIPAKKVTGGKRLKGVITERDELCDSLAYKVNENMKLSNEINVLDNKYADLTHKNKELQDKYENLINESLSKTDQYNKTLKAKLEELSEKEKLLLEREKALYEMQRIIARQDSITARLNEVLRNALLGFKADELSVEIKNGKVYVSMSDKLLFKSGSVTVESKGKEAIKLLADVLEKNIDIDILIEGHTDNIPIKTALYKDNWDLSVGRATSIVRMLTNEYKITPSRLTASGKGEYFPKASNETEEGRTKNRRTEIILSPKLDELMHLLNGN